jgi:hypothetical protein
MFISYSVLLKSTNVSRKIQEDYSCFFEWKFECDANNPNRNGEKTWNVIVEETRDGILIRKVEVP